jgi:hypothetical protein
MFFNFTINGDLQVILSNTNLILRLLIDQI